MSLERLSKYREPFSEFGKRRYRMGYEEGYKEAYEQAYEEGLKLAREQRLEEQRLHDKILLILEQRGISVDEGQRERIMSSGADFGLLRWWLKAARTAETAEDLFW